MKKIFNMKIREKKIKNPPVLSFLREKMQGSWVQAQMGTKLLKDSNGYKYDNSSRNRRRSEQRADLKKLCQIFEAMSARSYMDSIIPFLSQG